MIVEVDLKYADMRVALEISLRRVAGQCTWNRWALSLIPNDENPKGGKPTVAALVAKER